MSGEKKGPGPGYWMTVGVVIVVLGAVIQAATGNDGSALELGLVIGGAIFVFGVVAKAVQIGIRSSRE